MSIDSVSQAESTPEKDQPYEALGLKKEEYEEIRRLLGRRPTSGELAMYSVMWSEHCSYKHSKPLLSGFPTTGPRVVMGPGENAGAVDVGDGLAIVFKVESHNHPSAVEPFQGAATGVKVAPPSIDFTSGPLSTQTVFSSVGSATTCV